MSLNYKTKPCKQFFELGYCSYGIRCQFSHKLLKECEEENKISYLKILNEFNNSNEISHEVLKRPRLMTFEDICKCGNEIKEKNRIKLYEDIQEMKKKVKDEPLRFFSEDTNDEENKEIKNDNDNNQMNEENNNDENNNNNNNGKKRGRFISI